MDALKREANVRVKNVCPSECYRAGDIESLENRDVRVGKKVVACRIGNTRGSCE